MNIFKLFSFASIGTFFTLFGLTFFIIGGLNGISTYNFIQSSTTATGRVIQYREGSGTKNSTIYYPVVEFELPSGKLVTFNPNSGSSVPQYKINQSVGVLYDKSNPQSARIDSFFDLWFIPFVFGGAGVVFVLIGILFLIKEQKKLAMKKALQLSGQRIEATFTSAGRGAMVINGNHSFVVNCQWLNPVDNKIYMFVGDNIWYDPTPYVEGKKISVLIDPKNPKSYYVDLSSLPKLA